MSLSPVRRSHLSHLLTVATAFLFHCLTFTGVASATVYDLANDFSLSNNGSPNNWSYGTYSGGLNPGNFLPFTTTHTGIFGALDVWDYAPAIPTLKKILRAPTTPDVAVSIGERDKWRSGLFRGRRWRVLGRAGYQPLRCLSGIHNNPDRQRSADGLCGMPMGCRSWRSSWPILATPSSGPPSISL